MRLAVTSFRAAGLCALAFAGPLSEAPALAGPITFTTQDNVQNYTIPESGEYAIAATGASGGAGGDNGAAGGLGAQAVGDFDLTAGSTLSLYVGGEGAGGGGGVLSNGSSGGGGGGSFVLLGATVLVVGGGGGGGQSAFGTETGGNGGLVQSTGAGLGGASVGFGSGSGGGVNGDGISPFGCGGHGLTGSPPLAGGACLNSNFGGYGGGGGGYAVGAGGGGYDGGAVTGSGGGGGTSFVDMTIADGFVAGSASFVLAAGPGDGTVTITELDAVPAPEPTTVGLLGAGALATTWVRRRKVGSRDRGRADITRSVLAL